HMKRLDDYGGFINPYGEDWFLHTNDDRPEVFETTIGDHFRFTRAAHLYTVRHGQEPLRLSHRARRVWPQLNATGDSVLLVEEDGACYDIYNGYYAEARGVKYYAWANANELETEPGPILPGWIPLKDHAKAITPAELLRPKVVAGVDKRKHRGAAFHLEATADKKQYDVGEKVRVRFTLKTAGDEPILADPPDCATGAVVGSLRGPAYTWSLSSLAGGYRRDRLPQVRLEKGGIAAMEIETTDLVPGDYVLAAAYAGNPETEWKGRVRAPLLHFRVGTPPDDETAARLSHVIASLMDSAQIPMAMELREELQQSYWADPEKTMAALRPALMPEKESDVEGKYVGEVYDVLSNLRDPALIPFYFELLQSGVPEQVDRGYLDLCQFYHGSKDEAFKERFRAAVRDAFQAAEPTSKADIMNTLKVDLWPMQHGE
ncbi:MAG: hypothetical protein ABL994_13575, partial [Verrucomicrobiales bacterium]